MLCKKLILIGILILSGCAASPDGAIPADDIELSFLNENDIHVRSLSLLNDGGNLVLHGRVASLGKMHGASAFSNHLDVTVVDIAGVAIETVYVRLPIRVGVFDHRLEADIGRVSKVIVEYHGVRGGHI